MSYNVIVYTYVANSGSMPWFDSTSGIMPYSADSGSYVATMP